MARPIKGSEIAQGILTAAAVVGVIGLGLTMPGVLNVLGKEFLREKNLRRKQVRQAVFYLKRKKLLTVIEESGGIRLELTKEGKGYAQKLEQGKLVIAKPKKWDRKWRMVYFDIPEKQRWGRDGLRSLLKNGGFYQLQRSVFVHPFPCEEEINVVREMYNLREFVKVALVERFEGTEKVKEKFGLD